MRYNMDKCEEEIYDAFEHANRFKAGVLTGQKVIQAVKLNHPEEVELLINLSVDEGGLLLLRFNQLDVDGRTAMQIAEDDGNSVILNILKRG